MLIIMAIWTGIEVKGLAQDTFRRGEYPRCQDECLAKLEERMKECDDSYRRKGGRQIYEEQVKAARLAFDECIDRCEYPFPAK